MKKIIYITAMMVMPCVAQAQTATDMFQQFRKGMMEGYSNFRKSVLDGYADYLDTVWKEYKAFKGEARDEKPKPVTPPDVKTTPALPPAEDKPVVTVPKEKPQPTTPVNPAVPTVPTVPQAPQEATFSFYGARLKAPRMECAAVEGLKPQAVAAAWRQYEGSGMKKVAETLKGNVRTLGLNDWFAYEMVRECVNEQCPSASAASRVALQHFLLANMGYDVRIADCGGAPCLLFAVRQKVYARSYLVIDGKKYYIYQDNGKEAPEGGSLYTCELPRDAEQGNVMDMLLKGNIGVSGGSSHHCTLEYDGMTVEADVDVRTMEMLRRYPQMDVPNYAMSVLDAKLRKGVLEQLKPHIAGLSETAAANKLLHFVQHAFAYATDGDQHGYEKAYFLEENFYYPKNDCEDRAIFYAYLVRNLLGLDVHLIQFPGHECTAVNFREEVSGSGYVYDGKTFTICDPTYIGASIGQCMPDYRGTTPKVELWY